MLKCDSVVGIEKIDDFEISVVVNLDMVFESVEFVFLLYVNYYYIVFGG